MRLHVSKLNVLDPCKKLKCGVNAICKVFFATGKAFCACPYLMIGDPYEKCGKLFHKVMRNTLSWF